MSIVGAYGDGAELQGGAADPCLMGLGELGCLDTKYWLPKLMEEKTQQSNTTTLEAFNRLLRQDGVEGGVLYVEDLEKATKLLLAGYRDLTEEQLEILLKAANVLKASVPQSRGALGSTCTEQQPTPAQLIDEAVRFLISLGLTETLRQWEDAARTIGLNRVLPKVGAFSGQDWFNYQVALFILSVKEALEKNLINRYQGKPDLGCQASVCIRADPLRSSKFPQRPSVLRP